MTTSNFNNTLLPTIEQEQLTAVLEKDIFHALYQNKHNGLQTKIEEAYQTKYNQTLSSYDAQEKLNTYQVLTEEPGAASAIYKKAAQAVCKDLGLNFVDESIAGYTNKDYIFLDLDSQRVRLSSVSAPKDLERLSQAAGSTLVFQNVVNASYGDFVATSDLIHNSSATLIKPSGCVIGLVQDSEKLEVSSAKLSHLLKTNIVVLEPTLLKELKTSPLADKIKSAQKNIDTPKARVTRYDRYS